MLKTLSMIIIFFVKLEIVKNTKTQFLGITKCWTKHPGSSTYRSSSQGPPNEVSEYCRSEVATRCSAKSSDSTNFTPLKIWSNQSRWSFQENPKSFRTTSIRKRQHRLRHFQVKNRDFQQLILIYKTCQLVLSKVWNLIQLTGLLKLANFVELN